MKFLPLILLLVMSTPVQAIYRSGGGHDYYTLNYVTVHPIEKLVCYKGASECLEVGENGINHFVELMYAERKIKEDSFGYYAMLFLCCWVFPMLIYLEISKNKT